MITGSLEFVVSDLLLLSTIIEFNMFSALKAAILDADILGGGHVSSSPFDDGRFLGRK